MMVPATARVTFYTDPLPDDVYEALKTVPGVSPWEPYGKRTAWTAPYTAAWIAETILRRADVPYTADVPTPDVSTPDTVDRAWFVDRAVRAGVYPWVFDGFMLDVQVFAAIFATQRRRAHIWAEPGAGKTLIGIVAASAMQRPTVYVTAAGIVDQVADEWRRFTDRPVLGLRPPSRRRKGDPSVGEIMARPGAVLVMGYETMRDCRDEVLPHAGRVCTIFDESQYAKAAKREDWYIDDKDELQASARDNRSMAAFVLAKRSHGVICTTATPIANTLIDLWAQLTLVEPQGWGRTDTRFAKRHCDAHQGTFGWVKSGMTAAALPELNARLAWTVIQIPYEVSHGHLPPKRRMLVRVPPDRLLRPQAGQGHALRRLAKADKGGDGEASRSLLKGRLARACSQKRGQIADLVATYSGTGKGKVIVFSGLRQDCEDIGARVQKTGLQTWISHGEDSIDERMKIQRAYLAHPGPCALVATWQAWGTGRNLDDTDVVIFGMLPYTPQTIAQPEGRADRLSMTRPVLFIYVVAEGTVDETVVDLVSRKLRQVEKVTPGTRLGAFGGVERTLAGVDDGDALVARALASMADAEDDDLW